MSSLQASDAVPHQLDLVIDFVNTLDVEAGSDALATGEGLARWLTERGLLAPSAPPLGASQRREAIRLREALRALILAHNGAQPDARAARELDRVARRGELRAHFTPAGGAELAVDADGFPGALARLLVPVVEASRDGTWARVKACRAEDCGWAFYDRSRNRSGVWCAMAVCGNRSKVRAYRRRGPAGRSD